LLAAKVGASGPSLPYSGPTIEALGIDASHGRVIDPLLALRESITAARTIRDHCTRVIAEGFTYADPSVGGVLGILLELREVGVATHPDLVDRWVSAFDRLCEGSDPDDFLRGWTNTFRRALQLLAVEPDRKLLGSDPTIEPRRTKREL
jgi:hypothetical protein